MILRSIGSIAVLATASLCTPTIAADFPDPARSALIVVEFQKQWTEPGLYNWLIRDQYESRNVYENTRAILDHGRQIRIPVLHAPLVINPKEKKGWFAYLTFGQFFAKGSEYAEFTPGIVENADEIVTGRYAFDGFVGSDLATKIAATGATDLLFCGFTTEHCVEYTMKTAESLGYRTWLIPDCTATKNAKLQSKVESRWRDKKRLLPMSLFTTMELASENSHRAMSNR